MIHLSSFSHNKTAFSSKKQRELSCAPKTYTEKNRYQNVDIKILGTIQHLPPPPPRGRGRLTEMFAKLRDGEHSLKK